MLIAFPTRNCDSLCALQSFLVYIENITTNICIICWYFIVIVFSGKIRNICNLNDILMYCWEKIIKYANLAE